MLFTTYHRDLNYRDRILIANILNLTINLGTTDATWSFKGRFLLFQVCRNFANLTLKLSVSTFYKQISKFQQKVQR